MEEKKTFSIVARVLWQQMGMPFGPTAAEENLPGVIHRRTRFIVLENQLRRHATAKSNLRRETKIQRISGKNDAEFVLFKMASLAVADLLNKTRPSHGSSAAEPKFSKYL